MKKIITILITLFLVCFISINNVKAEVKVKSFDCFYDVKTTANVDIGTFQIIISNYNDGSSGSTMEIYYQDENKKNVYYSGKLAITDYYNNESNGGNSLKVALKKENFTSVFSKSLTCAPIYFIQVTGQMDQIDIDKYSYDNYVQIPARKILFKGPNDTDWISESQFKDRVAGNSDPSGSGNGSGNSDPSGSGNGSGDNGLKDFDCNYTMKFKTLSNNSSVVFSRKRNVANGNVLYTVTIDGYTKAVDSLDSEFAIGLGQYSNGEVRIKPADLKAIFNSDSCLAANAIFQYQSADMGQSNVFFITTNPDDIKENSDTGTGGDGSGEAIDPINLKTGQKPTPPNLGFGAARNCSEILGPNLTTVVKVGISAIQIVGAVLAIVYGMIALIPAVMSKDTDGLKQAEKKLVIMAIILLCIFLLRYFIKFIGTIFGFDLTCIV